MSLQSRAGSFFSGKLSLLLAAPTGLLSQLVGPRGSHQPASLFTTEGSGVALVGGSHSGPTWSLELVTLYP